MSVFQGNFFALSKVKPAFAARIRPLATAL